MPLAAYGGRREIMQKVAPLGPVYQAGTLSGNPVAVSAALALLERLDAGVYEKLEALGARMERGFLEGAKKANLEACVQRVGSMITPFFTKGPIRSFGRRREVGHDALRQVARRDALARAYWPPSQYEAGFLSAAHTEADVDATIAAATEAFAVAAV